MASTLVAEAAATFVCVRDALCSRPSVEYGSGALLAFVSVALWVIGIFAFRFGWIGNLLVQVVMTRLTDATVRQ
jgi:hypothetical protein